MFFNFFRNFFIFPFFVPNGRFFAVFFLAVVEISYARAFACARSLNPALCLVAPFGKTRICGAILCQTCVFAFLPPPLYPLPEEMPGCSFCPCLWQGSAAPLSSRLPLLTKGGGGVPPFSIPPLMERSAEPPHALPPLLVSSSTLPFMPPLMVRGGGAKRRRG